MKPDYTLGLFANLYPRYEGDSRGIFVKRMVDSLEAKNVKVIKAVKKSASPFAYSTFYLDSFVNSLKKDVDIFQAEYIPHSSIIPALMKSKRPLVLKFHGDDGLIYPYKNHFNKALFNLSVNRADHIITCSEALKTSLINLGVESEKITPIANGVDTSVFKPMNKEHCRESFSLDKNATICLYAGRIHPMKGIFDLIEAAKLNPDVTFIFGGPGPVPKHPSNCFFLGDISPEKIPILMNAADFLVLPSHSEGLGLVLLESLACGVPVIASNVGGCPEIIEDGEFGILIPPKNLGALSNEIQIMADNPLKRTNMGIKGKENIIKKYDSEDMVKKLMKIHENLIYDH